MIENIHLRCRKGDKFGETLYFLACHSSQKKDSLGTMTKTVTAFLSKKKKQSQHTPFSSGIVSKCNKISPLVPK